MDTITILFIILLVVCSAILFLSQKRENFRGQCASQCYVGSDGEIMDIYNCCECIATMSGGEYDPKFRACMCAGGYGDYCFKPVTNFLLSQ